MAIPFWFNVDTRWVSDSRAEWPFFLFCSMLMFSGCRAVRPNDYFLFIVQLGHAEWPSLSCCSMRDVQRVLSGPAEWPLFTVQCFNVQY